MTLGLFVAMVSSVGASNLEWAPPDTVSGAAANESFGGFVMAGGRATNGVPMAVTPDGADLFIVWRRQQGTSEDGDLYFRHWNENTGWDSAQPITTHSGDES
jgi:hypothetical protein